MALRVSPCLVLLCLLPAMLAVAADPPPIAPTPPDSATVAPGICLGRVTDARTGEPLASANVYVQGGQAGTISTLDGLFALRGAPAGPFTLVVTYLGYAPALTRVGAAREATLAIALEPTVYAGEEIVIDASRYGDDVHLSQANLTREEIERGQSERDIPVLLEDLPGVYASSDAGNGVGYTYLNIRGFDQRRVGVMINGIPLNDPEDHQVYWVDMPDLAESLEDIQVQRGITNSMGGLTAIGGTVNLITEVLGPAPAGRATLRAGSYGTSQQSLAWQSGLRGGRFATALRLSHLASDGYRQRAGSDQWAVFWSGQYVAPGHQVQANVYTGREVSHHAWDGIDAATLARDRTWNPETYPNAVDDFRQPHYELHWRWNVSDRVLLRNSVFAIHGEGFYENFKAGRLARLFSLDTFLDLPSDLKVDLVRRKWVRKDQLGWVPQVMIEHRGGRLVAGGDWYTFHSNHWGEVIGVAGFTPDDLTPPLKYADYEGDRSAWSAYVNEKWEAASGLTLLLDLQYQRKAVDFLQNATGNFVGDLRNAYRVTYGFFNPKGGVHWTLPGRPAGGEAALYAHVGVARREPADAELFDTFQDAYDLGARPLFDTSRPVTAPDGTVAYLAWSGPRVKPERVVDREVGAAWRGRALSFTLNGYWMDFRDEIVAYGGVDDDGAGIRGNAERTLHRGIEAGLTWRPHSGHLLTVAASRSWDRFDRFVFIDWDGARSDLSGHPIALFPDRLLAATWRAAWGRFDTTARVRAVGRQHLDNSGLCERTVDPYATLDLALGARLGRKSGAAGEADGGARVELRVRNVMDARYETGGYYDGWGAGNYYLPAAGRNYLAGVRCEF